MGKGKTRGEKKKKKKEEEEIERGRGASIFSVATFFYEEGKVQIHEMLAVHGLKNIKS